MSIRPGRSVACPRSITRASGGIVTAAPAATMRSPSINTIAGEIGRSPFPSIRRPARMATRVAIRAGRLIDGKGDRPISPAIVLIEGDRIVAAGAAVTIPPDARVIDLGQATLLPGLIDMHDHLTAVPENLGYKGLGVSTPREALYGAANARKTLEAGFTSVRNVGASGFSDVALRDAIAAGDIPGPRMLVSGPPLGITGGHCDNNLLPSEFHFREGGVADGPWEARAKVREVVKYGADLIKICASGGVLSKGDQPGTPQYSPEEMKALIEEAHRLGRRVAAHAHGTQSIRLACSIEST